MEKVTAMYSYAMINVRQTSHEAELKKKKTLHAPFLLFLLIVLKCRTGKTMTKNLSLK